MTIGNTKSNYFFYMTNSWLHWSTLNVNWENREAGQEVSLLGKGISYFCGMIGHAITLPTKVASFAFFFFSSVGFAVQFGISRFLNKSSKENLEVCEFRFKISLITCLDSLVASAVDTVGVVCPPAAYKIHDYLLKKLANFIVKNKIAFADITEKNYNASYAFRIFLDPKALGKV